MLHHHLLLIRLRSFRLLALLEFNNSPCHPCLLAEDAILANDIKLPQGTVVMAGVIINADAKIGEFCILNTKSSLGHDSVMADFSSLASGATTVVNVIIGVCSAIGLKSSVI